MLERKKDLHALRGLLKRHRAVGIIGARQVGKTTLARMLAHAWKGDVHFFDLENPEDLTRLSDPFLALKSLRGLVIIDEIQRQPEFFPVLRVLLDRPSCPARFLLLGSASPDLLRQGSESLAGRIFYHEIGGFTLDETGTDHHELLWIRGGLPRSYLAKSALESHEWRQGFIRTFLERDLPQLGIGISSVTMQRFWTMLAHYHGQTWNASEFGRSFGVADTTVRDYLDRLSAALVVRQLPPWYENISKRQVKAPKVYIADSGLLHALLNLRTQTDVESHPKMGASWEGFALNQVIRQTGAGRNECYFWATHGGAELDLLVIHGKQRLGFEFKRSSQPGVTPSMRSALTDLKLTRLDIVYPGDLVFPLTEKIRAVGITKLLDALKPLR
ncbi:MAG TPA: ATP-binding protein [Candidatus Hydrogenedentes bacterium]|nr:ATP-binding protein [Candidatus Hydrogenedentota bacterium]